MPVTRSSVAAAVRRAGWRPAAALAGAAVVALAGTVVPAAAAPGQPAGHAALLALAPPGLFTWGSEDAGALGNGSFGNGYGGADAQQVDTPAPVALPAGVTQLVGSETDGFALLSNGTLAVWGANDYGQLGDGSGDARARPYVLPGLSGITQVAAHLWNVLALDSSGAVWVWGDNYYGEAGNGTLGGVVLSPQRVPGLSGVVQVAASNGSDYALRSDGTVWAWGDNNDGELGDGTTVNRLSPVLVAGLTGISKIAAGADTAYAIRPDGTVMAWGSNQGGTLGNGTGTGMSAYPVQVPGLTGVSQISAGLGSTFALTFAAGTVWAWGGNSEGELGDGTTTARFSPEQTGLTGVSQIAAGGLVTAAVLSNGSVMTWGYDGEGELGTSTRDDNPHPSPVLVRTLAGASLVAAGAFYAMAIASPAPRIPSVIGYTQSDAAQVLGSAGYVLGRVATVIDLTCEYLGEVKAQTPAAGTLDPPGTAVSVTIGKAGGKCLG
jgi:alpha-tubulin suppressor-like RCC1 family protein